MRLFYLKWEMNDGLLDIDGKKNIKREKVHVKCLD